MRQLPKVNSLYEAVQTVIRENKKDHYNPTYFTRTVTNTTDLVSVCSNMINSQSSYTALTGALLSHPDLLTLEDFVVIYGKAWGFSQSTIEIARERVDCFDDLVKHRRYDHT